jgi:hypothetical protein
MADFYRPTKIEELEAKHPGIGKFVKEQYGLFTSHRQLVSMLEELYGETVSEQALSNHYRLRIWPEREKDRASYRDAHNRVRILLEEQKADPECDAARIIEAFAIQGVVEQQAQISDADPLKLIAEIRKWKQLEVEKEIETGKLQVALTNAQTEKYALELKIEQYRKVIANDEAASQIESGRPITAADIDWIREHVFGLPPRASQPAGDQASAGDPALPVPAKVG